MNVDLILQHAWRLLFTFSKQSGGKNAVIDSPADITGEYNMNILSYIISDRIREEISSGGCINIASAWFILLSPATFNSLTFICSVFENSLLTSSSGILTINRCRFEGWLFSESGWSVDRGNVVLNDVSIKPDTSLSILKS